ncbi:MAG: glycosyltransferase [Bacteroidetes bacterium]|nr:glycosyltransferase [Bacteroidota bacterium]
MISIVTAYYNRKQLFIHTLKSIKHQNSKHLLEVIAVDDGSEENERLEDLLFEFPFLKIIRLERKNKWYHNSCIPFNIGFKAAKGKQIIIQNPECLHYGDILDFTHNNLEINKYLSFGCYSLDKDTTNNIEALISNKSIDSIIDKKNDFARNDGDAGWYNHSIYRPRAYHFCTAITKKDLNSLGGFDELFSLGIAYDDDEFLSRIKKKKLNLQFVDNKLVLHQNHYNPDSNSFQNRDYKMHLMARNLKLFNKLSKKPYYKANTFSKYLSLSIKKFYIKIILNIVERFG